MRSRSYDLRTMRTDQGTKINYGAISDFVTVTEITHGHTERAARIQINVAKRTNQKHKNNSRTMSIDSSLSKAGWGHAIKYAPTTEIAHFDFQSKWKSFEKFFNIHTDWLIFKPFVCKAMIYIPLENRTKFDTTEENGIFVGKLKVHCSIKFTVQQQRILSIS